MTREAALVKPNGRVVTNPTHKDPVPSHPNPTPPRHFSQNPAQTAIFLVIWGRIGSFHPDSSTPTSASADMAIRTMYRTAPKVGRARWS